MSFKKQVLRKLDKIEILLSEHSVELGKNTVVLTEHHVRSSNLEARIRPIEENNIFVSKLAKATMAISAIGASLVGMYGYFFK